MTFTYNLQKFDTSLNDWLTLHIYNISEHKNAEQDMYSLYQINKEIQYRLVAVNNTESNSALENTRYLSCLTYES
jgi:hypothetical protein